MRLVRLLLLFLAVIAMFAMSFIAMNTIGSNWGKFWLTCSLAVAYTLVGLATRSHRPNSWQRYVGGIDILYDEEGNRHWAAPIVLFLIFIAISLAIWLA